MKPKTVDRIYGTLVVLGMVLILVGVFPTDDLNLVWVGGGLGAAGALFGMFFSKCPYCGAHLRTKFGVPKTCPICGKRLY